MQTWIWILVQFKSLSPPQNRVRQRWQQNSSQSPKQFCVCSLHSCLTSSCPFVMPGYTVFCYTKGWQCLLSAQIFNFTLWSLFLLLGHLSKARQALAQVEQWNPLLRNKVTCPRGHSYWKGKIWITLLKFCIIFIPFRVSDDPFKIANKFQN